MFSLPSFQHLAVAVLKVDDVFGFAVPIAFLRAASALRQSLGRIALETYLGDINGFEVRHGNDATQRLIVFAQ